LCGKEDHLQSPLVIDFEKLERRGMTEPVFLPVLR
jgi:hypothetical protein